MYNEAKKQLAEQPQKWLVTGAAGFIGSNLVETLLRLNQYVVGFDNFSTGYQKNIDEVLSSLSADEKKKFSFIKGDITNPAACNEATKGIDYILHQAALGSVSRSIIDPITSFSSNVQGYVNMLFAAKENHVKKFVYASSSAIYGDHPVLPKQEKQIGKPLSPYALTKYIDELTAEIFRRIYGIQSVGLRYFNVFGARQDPEGAYAAVIPLWIKGLIKNEPIYINGDGKTSRDFCYIENVVQANILAALSNNSTSENPIYNISCGSQTTLTELYKYLKSSLEPSFPHLKEHKAIYRDFRDGDIRHSLADITAAETALGYKPQYQMKEGLSLSLDWYKKNLT